MKTSYSANNQTEISKVLDAGQKKLEIDFIAEGQLRDLPGVFRIPDPVIKEHIKNGRQQFFLNVDFDHEPVQWVIDIGERPL